jgi:hypothetical protein
VKTAILPELVLLYGGISDFGVLKMQRSNERTLFEYCYLVGIGVAMRWYQRPESIEDEACQ